jgi:signal transduction histidine kinase
MTEQLVCTDRSADRGEPLILPAFHVLEHPRDTPFSFTQRHDSRPMPFRGLIRRRPDGDYLLVAQDMTGIRAFRALLLQFCLWGGLATVLIGFIGAAMAGADAVRCIDGVTRAIQRIVRGDLSGRLPTRAETGDLDRLAQEVNFMLGEIERLMSEVKGVCDNVAHDLRTPLTRLLAGLERAHRRAGSAEQYAAAIDEAIQDVRGVLKTFAAMLRIAELESGARRAGFTSADLSQDHCRRHGIL